MCHKDDHRPRKGPPDAGDAFRMLAAAYLGYLIYQLITDVFAGNVPEKTVPWVIAAAALFFAGIVWLIWPAVKRLKEILDADGLH